MKKSHLISILLFSLIVSACGSGAASPTPTVDVSAPVLAEDILIAEGRVEPVRFAELALNASRNS